MLEKEARMIPRSIPVHLLARNSMALLSPFSMSLSFYVSDFLTFYLTSTGNATCGTAIEASSSLLPDSGWAEEWSLATLSEKAPLVIVGMLLLMLHSALA